MEEKIFSKRNYNKKSAHSLQFVTARSCAQTAQQLPPNQLSLISLEAYNLFSSITPNLIEKQYASAVCFDDQERIDECRNQLTKKYASIKNNFGLMMKNSESKKNKYFKKCKQNLEKQIIPHIDFANECWKEEYHKLYRKLEQQCDKNLAQVNKYTILLITIGGIFGFIIDYINFYT